MKNLEVGATKALEFKRPKHCRAQAKPNIQKFSKKDSHDCRKCHLYAINVFI
jgi:nitrate/TMAO reductase-like tetraheme cytochrome c subunit